MFRLFLIGSLLPFQVLIVAALTFYYGNRAEVNFKLMDALPFVLIVSFLAATVFSLVLFLIRKKQKSLAVLSGLLIGLSIATWIQSQLLVWKFGPLDGRGIDWNSWSAHAIFEYGVWFSILVISVFIFLKFKSLSHALPKLVLMLGFVSILSAWVTSPGFEKNFSIDDLKPVSLHPENNIIIIMLDTFQSDFFDTILMDYPGEVSFLDGFSFYDNVIASYPTTRPNIPAIFSGGNLYKNLEPFDEYAQSVRHEFNLFEQLNLHGYSENVVSNVGVLPPGAGSMRIMSNYTSSYERYFRSTMSLLDYAFFRALPVVVKEKVYDQGRWTFVNLLSSNYPPSFAGNDLRFVQFFSENAVISNDRSNGAVHFFHFWSPHLPLVVNENFEAEDGLSGVDGFLRQARASLMLPRVIFQTLDSLGVYDNSEIFIIADHGSHRFIPNDSEYGSSENVPLQVLTSSRALFLHKPPMAGRKGIERVQKPLYLYELNCLIQSVIINNDSICEFVLNNDATSPRERVFYNYQWSHEYWERDFMPPITEYVLSGHAFDNTAWRRGSYRYMDGRIEVLDLPQSLPLRALYPESSSDGLLISGWSGQEPTHRWTDGQKASMQFRVQDYAQRDLVLRLNANGYLGGGLPHQKVGVVVNGAQVAEWLVADVAEHTAVIPANLVGDDGLINLSFDISDPRAPCDYSESTDCRKLGLAVRELVVDYLQ